MKVLDTVEVFIGWQWEARILERFCEYVIDGVPGKVIDTKYYKEKAYDLAQSFKFSGNPDTSSPSQPSLHTLHRNTKKRVENVACRKMLCSKQ